MSATAPKALTTAGMPGSVAAVAGFQQVSVSWAAPAANGGAPITSYKISISWATFVVTVTGSARSAVVAGFGDPTAYKVLVAAVDNVGTGKAAVTTACSVRITA